jgi:hypothetical protein
MVKERLEGKTFNRLTVIKFKYYSRRRMWECRCICGNIKIVSTTDLKDSSVKSCGCLRRESSHTRTHGLSKTPEYKVWKEIKRRCHNPNASDFKYYGGRGICVYNRWLTSFVNFINDMGPRPSDKHSLERRDNNKNYCKSNCYWATRKEQGNNTRRNKMITYNGHTLTLSQWCDKLGLNRKTVGARLVQYNWTIQKALSI